MIIIIIIEIIIIIIINNNNNNNNTLDSMQKLFYFTLPIIIIKGTHFGQGNDPPPHAWNAVYLRGGWRLVDCTWGAGQVNPETQVYEKVANEHFFLTDPDELIYTHFPYDEAETK